VPRHFDDPHVLDAPPTDAVDLERAQTRRNVARHLSSNDDGPFMSRQRYDTGRRIVKNLYVFSRLSDGSSFFREGDLTQEPLAR
jgi:hypothetical protein